MSSPARSEMFRSARRGGPVWPPKSLPPSRGKVPSAARRMRVLSRKVALRARESPPDIPLPLKSPLSKGGRKAAGRFPLPEIIHGAFLFFSVWAAHRGAWKRPDGGIGPYSRSNAPSDMPQGRTVCARGPPRSAAPTAKPEAPPEFRRGGTPGPPAVPSPPGRRNAYLPASAPSLIPSTNPRRKDSRSLSSPASS